MKGWAHHPVLTSSFSLKQGNELAMGRGVDLNIQKSQFYLSGNVVVPSKMNIKHFSVYQFIPIFCDSIVAKI